MNDIVNIYIKEGTLTKKSATIIITENIDYDIIYGEYYKIEKFNYRSNTWEDIKVICDNCAFNDIGYSVTPNHPLELKVNWENMYGELPKGLYRIVKDAFFESDTPVNGNNQYTISVEFIID